MARMLAAMQRVQKSANTEIAARHLFKNIIKQENKKFQIARRVKK
jgi:hypothetical protein